MTIVRSIIDPVTGQALFVTPDDPSVAGLDAQVGSLANQAGGGVWWAKTGTATTAWSQFALSSGFLPLSGGSLNAGANLTVPGTLTAGALSGPHTGNSSTATALQTARLINGVSFNGTADITVPAAAGTLTGATLAAGVTASSLTSVGTLTSLTVSGNIGGSDITASRASAPTTGVLYFGNNGLRYIYYNGTTFDVSGAPLTVGGSTALTAGNFNSYAPTLTGTGASGSWGISVTGSAASATTATRLATARLINGASFDGTADITLDGQTLLPSTVRIGVQTGVSGSLLTAVFSGNGIEFGHANSAGYRSTLGAESSSGKPFITFFGEAGTTANTYTSRGILSLIIRSGGGDLEIGSVASANLANQAFVQKAYLNTAGSLTLQGNLALGAAGQVTTSSGSLLMASGSGDLYLRAATTNFIRIGDATANPIRLGDGGGAVTVASAGFSTVGTASFGGAVTFNSTANTNSLFYVNASARFVFAANAAMYPDTATTSYQNAIQIREAGGAANAANSGAAYAPRLALHWGNIVASQVAVETSGRVSILDAAGTSYQSFIANNVYAAGTIYAANNGTISNSSGYINLQSSGDLYLRGVTTIYIADNATTAVSIGAGQGTVTFGTGLATHNGTIRMVNRGIELNKASGAGAGYLSWYSTGTYNTWLTYMSTVGTGSGPLGVNPSAGTSGVNYVNSYAIRNLIESVAGYGFTWETMSNGAVGGVPTTVMELCTSGVANGASAGPPGGVPLLKMFGDIMVRRSSTTGVLYFSDTVTKYLYYDGSDFRLSGGNSFVLVNPSGTYGSLFAGYVQTSDDVLINTSGKFFKNVRGHQAIHAVFSTAAASGTAYETNTLWVQTV